MILLFDLDGPILDVRTRYYRAYSDGLRFLEQEPLGPEEYWNLKRRKIPDQEILRMSGSEGRLREFRSRRDFLIEQEELLRLDCVWPQLRPTYEALFAQVPAILVTLRSSASRTLAQLDALGIRSWFQSVLAAPSGPEERWRTKVKLVREANVLPAQPSSSVFVGDTETDIIAGKELGSVSVAVTFGIRTEEALASLGADVVCRTPDELSAYLKTLLLPDAPTARAVEHRLHKE